MRALSVAVLLACAPGAAAAQNWTATITGSGSQADADNSPMVSASSVSIERRFETSWIGGALAFSQGETNVPEINASIDQESIQASLWWGTSLGAYDLTLGIDHTDEQLDGGFTFSGADIAADGDTRTTGVSATLSRTFGEASTLTPSFSLSYAETETELALESGGGATANVSSTANGLTGAAQLDGSTPLAQGLALQGGLAFIATDEAAAESSSFNSGSVRQRQEEGAASWGEAYVGLEWAASESAFVSASLGSTIGRDLEEAFGSVSLGWRF